MNTHVFFYLNLAYFFFKVELLKHITVHVINVFIKLSLFLFKKIFESSMKNVLDFDEKISQF